MPLWVAPSDYPSEPNAPAASSGVSAAQNYQEYWDKGNVFSDFFGHTDTFSHNEALAAYEREKEASKEAFEREADFNSKAARENREWEKMMSDTAMQRKVADYVKAGFSPLAALEGAVGASSPSGAAATVTGHKASANPAHLGANQLGSIFGALVTVVAMIASKGISAAGKAAAASGKAAKAAAEATAFAKYKGVEEAAKNELQAFYNLKPSLALRFHGDINAWRKAGRPR